MDFGGKKYIFEKKGDETAICFVTLEFLEELTADSGKMEAVRKNLFKKFKIF